MSATLNDALYFVRSMSARARKNGYVLALFGSTVIEGRGKDVDVFAVPWRQPSDISGSLERAQ